MNEKSCESEEVEECLLLVEFNGVIDEEFLLARDSSKEAIEILGLETEAPILQLGNFTFEGNFEDTVGTAVFFEKPGSDAKSKRSSISELEFAGKTHKKLNLKRIFFNKKEDCTNSTEQQKS